MIELAVTMDQRRRMRLQILPDRIVGLAQERGRVSRGDEFYVPMNRQRVPMEEIAAPRGAINRNLIRAENETSEGIACVTGARQVAPRASRVAGVNANAVAMNAARRLA